MQGDGEVRVPQKRTCPREGLPSPGHLIPVFSPVPAVRPALNDGTSSVQFSTLPPAAIPVAAAAVAAAVVVALEQAVQETVFFLTAAGLVANRGRSAARRGRGSADRGRRAAARSRGSADRGRSTARRGRRCAAGRFLAAAVAIALEAIEQAGVSAGADATDHQGGRQGHPLQSAGSSASPNSLRALFASLRVMW